MLSTDCRFCGITIVEPECLFPTERCRVDASCCITFPTETSSSSLATAFSRFLRYSLFFSSISNMKSSRSWSHGSISSVMTEVFELNLFTCRLSTTIHRSLSLTAFMDGFSIRLKGLSAKLQTTVSRTFEKYPAFFLWGDIYASCWRTACIRSSLFLFWTWILLDVSLQDQHSCLLAHLSL